MRKRVTFDELARSTLVKQTVTPSPLPYDPPYDNTFAIMELRQKMDLLRKDAENAEDARYREARAARDLGVTPELLRQMTEGITTDGSNMHDETRRQAQNHDAAAQRRQQLFADQFFREQAAQRVLLEQQQRATEEIKSSLRGATGSSSAAAAAAQEGARAPATPSDGFQTPKAAAATPADRFSQAFPKSEGAKAKAPTPEEAAASAALEQRYEDADDPNTEQPTHKPKTSKSAKQSLKEALKEYRQGQVAAQLKQSREEQKQKTATGQTEDTTGKGDTRATSSATGHLAASILTEGGASSSGGGQTTLPEFSRSENDASKATHDRKSNARGSGGAGTGKGDKAMGALTRTETKR